MSPHPRWEASVNRKWSGEVDEVESPLLIFSCPSATSSGTITLEHCETKDLDLVSIAPVNRVVFGAEGVSHKGHCQLRIP